MPSLETIGTKPLGIILAAFLLFSLVLKNQKKIKKGYGLFVKKRPEKKCFECNGFGITRCNLCSGRGFVSYEKKFQRFDPCPKCLQKRYDICPFCRGSGQRVLYGEVDKKSFLKFKERNFKFF